MTEITHKGHTIRFWRLGERKEFYAFTIDGYQYPNSCSTLEVAKWLAKRVIDDGDSKYWGRTNR